MFKWRSALGVLCDKRVLIKIKAKFYKTVIRPTILYGAEFDQTFFWANGSTKSKPVTYKTKSRWHNCSAVLFSPVQAGRLQCIADGSHPPSSKQKLFKKF